MAYFIAKCVVEKVGIDLGQRIVRGVISTARSISSLMGFISNEDDQSDLATLLRSADVEVTVKILECIVSELDVDRDTPDSIVNALKGLHGILLKIEGELERIKDKVEYNRSLYFLSSIRSYRFGNSIKRITNYMLILKNRKELLFETIEISHKLTKGHINKSILEGTMIIPNKSDKRKDVLKQLESEGEIITLPRNNKEIKQRLENSKIDTLDDEF